MGKLCLKNEYNSKVENSMADDEGDYEEQYDEEIDLAEDGALLVEETQKKDLGNELLRIHPEARVDTIESVKIIESSKYDVIECFILKTIKPSKVNKNDLQKIVESKCKFSITPEGFNKCMKRLFDLDYFEYQNDDVVYVP